MKDLIDKILAVVPVNEDNENFITRLNVIKDAAEGNLSLSGSLYACISRRLGPRAKNTEGWKAEVWEIFRKGHKDGRTTVQ